MKRKLTALLCALLLCLPALAQAGTAMTSFYPIWLLALNLADGIGGIEVVNLAEPTTGCLHDYTLSAGDMKALASADLLLVNGAGMESYLELVYEAFPDLPVTDASAGIPLLENPEGSETPYNAHIWLNAANASKMAENLCAGMAEAWPEHAEALQANLAAFQTRLAALDAELKAGLADLPRRDIVTFHEAFPYFAEAYGLHVAAVVNLEPGDALSPARLAELVRVVRSYDNPPLFVEPQYSDLAAKAVAAETGAPIYTLDPAVTGPEEVQEALGWYEQVMRENMRTLRQALGAED